MLSDFLFVRNLLHRGGRGEGAKLPFSAFAVPGYTGVAFEDGGFKMFKVSDDIPAITENDCGCFVWFTDTNTKSYPAIPLEFDDEGNRLNEDKATLQMGEGIGVFFDPKEEVAVMMWADDAMYVEVGFPEPGTYVNSSMVLAHWAFLWGSKEIEE